MRTTPIMRAFLVFLLFWFTFMLCTTPGGAMAYQATSYQFSVTTTNDTHDAHPGDGVCADQNGQCSLRAAIEEGNALPTGSSIAITMPVGTYGLTLGTLGLTANMITITGAGRKTTIIKGNQTFGILSVSSAFPVQISRLTIEEGDGGISNSGTLTVSNSTITANVDGGIFNGGTMTINNSTISGNSASFGGGIDNESDNTILTVSNSIIKGNSVSDSGGGIYNRAYATVRLNYSTISGNSAGLTGGGIYDNGYHGGSNVTVSNSTISGNSASSGGGIFDDAADVSVSNSTISGNSATSGDGGAIDFPVSDGGSVTVSNSTISGNSATGKGGNIANTNINGPFTLTGTIVANSTKGPNCSGKITDKGYNLDSGTSCRFTLSSDLNNTDPMLGHLQNNGGPTKTMALSNGSKAIDWVLSSDCPATDQRGHRRPDNREQVCDIGAYESAY